MDNITKDKAIEEKEKGLSESNQNASLKTVLSEINGNVQNTEFNTAPFKLIQKLINAISKLFKAK